jgi:hypothetical protein
MSTWKTKQGSYHRRIAIDLTSISTVGASSVTFKMRKRGADALVVDNVGTIDSPTRVSYQFVSPQLDDPGSYKLEIELQFVDGPERVPTEGFTTVIIEENLG